MQQGLITTVLLPVALGVIMLGLGLSLSLADFRRVIVYPRAVVIGLGCQMLVLPFVCLGIAHAFQLAPELAIGLMLLAASPGGAIANLYSHLAHGDVALNITLTAVNSVLSMITLPIVVGLSLDHFLGGSNAVPLQPDKVIQVVAIVLTPVAIGMIVRAHRPAIAARLNRPVRILSAVFQAIAIGMEIGIHNGTLAIAVALNVLGNPAMSIPPAVYSLIMFFTATAFGYWVARPGAAGAAALTDRDSRASSSS
jgi:bile acid:Na+ symporter, BASS family